jgi:protein-tyrosine phosphatase
MIDAARVWERLYIGSAPPAGTELRARGFTSLVLCAKTREYEKYAGYSPTAASFPGLFVWHVPLDDGEISDVDLARAHDAANAVAHAHALGHRVLVTCWMGRNRSGLVLGLALRCRLGMTGRRARELIQACRHEALTNEDFAEYLDSLGPPGRGRMMEARG